MAVRAINESEFQSEVLGSAGVVVVDFFATWCPPCRALAPLLDRLSEEYAGRVSFVKVDTDECEDLAERYNVRTIPTLIAFKGGSETNRVINPRGRAPIDALVSV
jgi:thioredoxin 1